MNAGFGGAGLGSAGAPVLPQSHAGAGPPRPEAQETPGQPRRQHDIPLLDYFGLGRAFPLLVFSEAVAH